MSIIGPSTWGKTATILLCSVKFNRNYSDVLSWEDDGTPNNIIYKQWAYFTTVCRYSFTMQSPPVISEGYFDIELPYYQAAGCNYAAIRLNTNTTITRSYWFVWVDRCEELSINTTRVYFTVDVMQTSATYYLTSMLPQYVLRFTPPTDNLFENLVEDDVDLGDETVVVRGNRTAGDNISVALVYSKIPPGTSMPINPGMRYGLMCPLGFKTYNLANEGDVARALLPLQARRQPADQPEPLAEPCAVRFGSLPRNADHRKIRRKRRRKFAVVIPDRLPFL